jgi:hypothetical protein
MGHKVLYALFMEEHRLGRAPFLNMLLQLITTIELDTSTKSLQAQDQRSLSSVPEPDEISDL